MGTLSAESPREAQTQLAELSLFPLEVEAQTSAADSWRGRRIKKQLIATTMGQLADLLRSGVPLLRSLAVLRDQNLHPGLKEILTRVYNLVEDGATLPDAMARHPRVFNEMAVSMVRAGSEGGFLEDALERVADFTEKQEDIKSRTIGALAYPMFLGGVGTLIVTALIIFIVPKFDTLFEQLRRRGEMPLATEGLMSLSKFLGQWGLVVLVAIVLGMLYLRKVLQTDAGKLFFDRFKIRVPLAGTIFLNMAVARFCRILGTMLHNGVPILKSMDISAGASGNRVLEQAIRDASENVSSGESLTGPLRACGHFPTMVIEMISVAEEANKLETVLTDIADGLERRTWRQLDLFVKLLEPVMLLVLAAVVLVVVAALLMPVMKMSTVL
jgi:general secretion pathway protein F/type IV pilus assembly protein PilC